MSSARQPASGNAHIDRAKAGQGLLHHDCRGTIPRLNGHPRLRSIS